MLIKNLRLQNFRQFKGKTEVNFSCDDEKNVTVILGDNTFGKTTLLQAFNWCLYGVVNFPNNDKNLLNYEISARMQDGEQETVEVEITLLHDNTQYIITRTQKYNCGGGKVIGEAVPKIKMSYLQGDGQTKPIQENKINEIINNILPKDLSTYFFFDTERISTVSNRKDIGKAVKDFLGLSALENALRHLGDRTKSSSVIGKIYGDMDLKGDNCAQEALDKMQAAREKKDFIEKNLEDCKNQIEHYEERKEEIEKILRDNQLTAQLQKDKEKIEQQIKTEEKILAQSIENYFGEFNASALRFFVRPLIDMADNFLKEVKIDEKGVSDITKNSIMELIKRGRCICGREICEGNEAFENLMAEIKFVPPESIGVTVRTYRQMLKNFSQSFEQVFNRLKDIHENIEQSKSRINDWNYDVDDYSKKIAGKENMSRFENELVNVKRRLEDFGEEKENLIQKIGAQERDIEYYQKIYDTLIASSAKNKERQEYLSYAEELKDWLEPTCKKNELKIREKLESEVNKIFDQMCSGKRRVEIDEKYRVELIAKVEDKEIVSGESEGANRVKNFAFIAGLVALAKRQILKDESGISSEPYPLVMDAPFSNADEKHTTSISKVLPEIAEQIIMFVMQKDWRYAEPVMSHRVGKKYFLQKNSETFTNIKEA